jgi:hypothetical protein
MEQSLAIACMHVYYANPKSPNTTFNSPAFCLLPCHLVRRRPSKYHILRLNLLRQRSLDLLSRSSLPLLPTLFRPLSTSKLHFVSQVLSGDFEDHVLTISET